MTRLLLVRHAPSDSAWEPDRRLCGWYDPPLGDSGMLRARRLAADLMTSGATAVYASPLRRAWQTAEPISAALHIAAEALPDLREISCGMVDGMLLDAVRERYPDHWHTNLLQQDDEFRWPGGESYTEFRQRVRACLEELSIRHCGESVIVVAHTGVVTQVLGMLYGWNPARWDRRRPEHTALTIVDWESGQPRSAVSALRK